MSYVSMRTFSGANSFAASSSAVLYEPFLLLPEIPSILTLGFASPVVCDTILLDKKDKRLGLQRESRSDYCLLRRRCRTGTQPWCRCRSRWGEGNGHSCAPFPGIE